MATKLTDTQTVTATGVFNPATLAKFPEGGCTFSVEQVSGTSPTITVQLRAWNTGMTNKEVLATFVLPVVGGAKNGDVFDSLPVFSTWDDWDWNVTALGGTATPTFRLSAVGVGV